MGGITMSGIDPFKENEFSSDSAIFLDFISRVSDKAREIAIRYFDAQPTMEQKADRTPVTQADREIETLIVNAIKERFPTHTIVGEEFGEQRPSDAAALAEPFTWIVDPIDGTGSFAVGNPLFGTLIGVLRNGSPWIGSIDMPVLGQRFRGSPAGACRNGVAVNAGQCVSVASARLCTTSPDIFDQEEKSAFDRVACSARLRRFGGDCYNYALLAMGRVDLVIEAALQPYDYLPLVPLVEAAGGVMTDWDGQSLRMNSNGRVIAAANADLHREALGLLNLKA
jgi:myo-inositol-1(or 4)-monophosphatase